MSYWTKETAEFWTNYVPPCRPSEFELLECSLVLTKIRNLSLQKPSVLILGSTTEFRDWAFSEYCNINIMDNSEEYYQQISQELHHKNLSETVFNVNWQDMLFDQQFDLIVGDLVIGNLKPHQVKDFLYAVNKALKPNGYFVTKSFFYNDQKAEIMPSDFFNRYETYYSHLEPFTFNAYNLTVHCLDKQSFTIEFYNLYCVIKEAYDQDIITEKTYNRFLTFGWQKAHKNSFYVMPLNLWNGYLKEIFVDFEAKIGPYYWSEDFPLFICKKNRNI